MLEFYLQGSDKQESPWLVPLQRRNMPGNEWKFNLLRNVNTFRITYISIINLLLRQYVISKILLKIN